MIKTVCRDVDIVEDKHYATKHTHQDLGMWLLV